MTQSNRPIFSVIIPTFHRNDHLIRCLDALMPSIRANLPDVYQVIVTDDGFKSSAQEVVSAKYPSVLWAAGPRRGPAANRNNGAARTTGDWLIFVDDDCIPDAGLLAAYRSASERHPGSLLFQGRIHPDRPRQRLDEECPANETGGRLWSCNFMIKTCLFFELGGFDDPSASVCHPWRLAGGWRQLSQKRVSGLMYLHKHPAELRRTNSLYFFRAILSHMRRQLLPMVRKGKLKGIGFVGLKYLNSLVTAFQVMLLTIGRSGSSDVQAVR